MRRIETARRSDRKLARGWPAVMLLATVLYCLPAAAARSDAARGQTLAAPCLACHGTEGFKADPQYSVPRLGWQNARYLYDALTAYHSGERVNALMQPFVATLKDQDLRDLAAYFEKPAADEQLVAAVKALGEGTHGAKLPVLVEQLCGGCHGEAGGGALPEVPTLAGQHADYMVHAMQQYQQGKRRNAVMEPIARQLSTEQINEVAQYYSINTHEPFSLRTAAPPLAGKAEAAAAAVAGTAPPGPARTGQQIIGGLQMVNIPGGTFTMGDDASEGFAVGAPKHAVRLRAFRMGKYEVTFEEYDAFAKETGRKLPDDEGWGRGSRPVINTSWNDAQAFIDWLNQKSGRHFALPSEAQWEYAARGGTRTVYWWGNEFDSTRMNANGINTSDHWRNTAPVGQFAANPFGLHDTSGNVAERVVDCWHSSYAGAPNDGSAWTDPSCLSRIARGGSWNLVKRPMRSSARMGVADSIVSMAVGFRLAETIP